MINSIFQFDDELAYEIMTPRTDVFLIDINDSTDEYLDELMELRYSRIPVCEDDTDNIIGILHIKDYLIKARETGFDKVDIRSILRKPYFVPETKNIDALFFELRRRGVELRQDRVTGLTVEDGVLSGVSTEHMGEVQGCQGLILATGGASYPRTGSTGDGYKLAQMAGHRIVPLRGSLVPLESGDACCVRLQGLSLRNVELRVKDQKGKTVFREQGELLFTHFGLSGPLVLSASAHMDFNKNQYTAHIDLKPALDEQKLDARLLRDFTERANQDYANALGGLVPRSMVPVLVQRTGVAGDTKVHDIRKGQRRRLLETLKDFRIPLSGPRPVEEAVVTSGGVTVGEVCPRTMESKKAARLYFAGEVLDVDAYTGGFNLQIAWSTGYAAGLAAAERALN